ncbi:MAG: LytR/AlgR family response regulator transcription factor [Sarcina sp.]
MTINIFICEDNELQRNKLTKIINNIILIENLDMKIALSTHDPNELINYVTTDKDLSIYFLDVNLENDINGFDLASMIRKYDPIGAIIFITTHSEMSYLTFLYKIEAMDYIIKDDFFNIEERINECILQANKKFSLNSIKPKNNLTIKIYDTIVNIDYNNIIFLKTAPNSHKIIVQAVNRQIEFYGKLKDIENKLTTDFYRCHKCCIINKNMIKKIDIKNKTISMTSGFECPASAKALKYLIKEIQT